MTNVALARAHYEAGRALEHEGKTQPALHRLNQALALVPQHPICHYLRGCLFRSAGRIRDALASYNLAVALAPEYAEAHLNRGNILRELDQSDAALDAYDKSLAAKPGYVNAHTNRATVFKDLGRLPESVAELRRVITTNPAFLSAQSNLLVTIPYMSEYSAEEVAREHRQFGERHETPLMSRWQTFANVPDPERPLRVGYLSPQFRAHVMAPAILPILQHHRRDRVSVHVFAHVPEPDAMTERMRAASDEWTYIHKLSDDDAAQRVRASAIDVLVHPMGHWASNRLMVLARKPAPIQVSYLCNSPTTGLRAIDYSIVDRWLDHDGTLSTLMTEVPYSLPNGFQVNTYDAEPQTHPPPVLRAGRITFGSFNNPAKLADAALQLWSRVLAAIPTAQLLIKGRGLDRPAVAAQLQQRLSASGIALERVQLRGRIGDFNRYMESHGDIDIMLDTIPFTGGRTTLDALWMGVPVMTLVGAAVYGRFSYSHLARSGAAELCAFSADEFVRIAAELAASPERLQAYRSNLRRQIKSSSMMDAPAHVAELEDAFRTMWRRWCRERAGGSPASP
jgi:protein O-GlcNAc transferase